MRQNSSTVVHQLSLEPAAWIQHSAWVWLALFALVAAGCQPTQRGGQIGATVELIPIFLSENTKLIDRKLEAIANNWQPGYAIVLVELSGYSSSTTVAKIHSLLMDKTGIGNFDRDKVFGELWKLDAPLLPDYADFKAELYGKMEDKRFSEYFDSRQPTTIRLDEVMHGGVKRDGIPPLKDPKVLTSDELEQNPELDYLADSDIVFGVSFGGEARAYPKRILAWHEMVKDHVGGRSINGVYCTLCGSMIVYDTMHNGEHYELGTSGFLYRSNKLMYDHATKSLWSTLEGKPVIGPLVGQGIELQPLSVVTTTWGEWRRSHPQTTVLSLNTGHRRDYSEGAAYREYFATDKLMFDVPLKDRRLANKEPVLALVETGTSAGENREDAGTATGEAAGNLDRLAITIAFLQANPVYQCEVGSQPLVVFTSPDTGAARAYARGQVEFTQWNPATGVATDAEGNSWQVTEAWIQSGNQQLERYPSHSAFWFGWFAAFPETRLVMLTSDDAGH